MENAIANHEFEKARFYSDEERKERENMRQLREKYNLDDSSTGCVTKDDIEDVVARWTGVPMTSIKEEEITKLLRIEEELHKRVISQEKAISALARAIRRSRAGLKSSNRPAGSFLFLGPTGVGKTEVARALAGFLFGSEKSLVRFDMSEYMEKHSVSKLIGSPPGYVGYEEGGQLTERVKRNPYSIILLDEIEKAHPDIYNILLQVFEDGQLTDGLGNQVDFKNTIIIMTSNLGARFLEKRGHLGFSTPMGEGVSAKVEDMVRSEVKKAFNPEFLNRLDEVILFTSLTDDDLIKIIDLLVNQVNVQPGGQAGEDPPGAGRRQVHSRQDLRRPQLRRASVAPRLAEVHRGSAVGSADSGLAAAPRRAGGLSWATPASIYRQVSAEGEARRPRRPVTAGGAPAEPRRARCCSRSSSGAAEQEQAPNCLRGSMIAFNASWRAATSDTLALFSSGFHPGPQRPVKTALCRQVQGQHAGRPPASTVTTGRNKNTGTLPAANCSPDLRRSPDRPARALQECPRHSDLNQAGAYPRGSPPDDHHGLSRCQRPAGNHAESAAGGSGPIRESESGNARAGMRTVKPLAGRRRQSYRLCSSGRHVTLPSRFQPTRTAPRLRQPRSGPESAGRRRLSELCAA